MRTKTTIVALAFGAGLLGMACGGHRSANRSAVIPASPHHNQSGDSSNSQAVAAFALSESSVAAIASPPVSLTASDGTGLFVDKLVANVHLHGPLAVTEVVTTFTSPTSSDAPARLEGRFRITLPPRSSMMRLAMKINGEWREADAAELGAARETYEEIVHRRRDPLLVEQRREREISARVFPIFAGESKEIAITYISEIGPDLPVTFPLRGLPVVSKLDVSVIDGATEPYGLHLENERPTSDVHYTPHVEPGARGRAATNEPARANEKERAAGNVVALRVAIPTEAKGAPDPIATATSPVVFLIETSASKDLEAATNLINAIAQDAPKSDLSKGARASIVAYDQSTERLYDGELGALASSTISKKALAARGAMGASDLERGLLAAAEEARRIHATRVVIIGGGAPTTGASDPQRLREAAGRIASAGVERLDVLGTSALADLRVYRPLVIGGLFVRDGMLVDDAAHVEHGKVVASRLANRVAHVPVSVEGATWSVPSTFEASSPGEERVVLAALPVGGGGGGCCGGDARPVRVHVGDTVTTFSPTMMAAAPLPILDHAIAAAKLNGLVAKSEREGWDADPLLRRDVIALSRKHRLASPLTALIVLESEADRATLRSKEARNDAPVAAPPTAPPPTIAAASRSRSVSGRGSGHGRMSGAHVVKAPMLRMGSTQVNGRIPPETIQRDVRQKMGIFRGCYEEGLRRRGPHLSGRVVVRFVIGHDGSVIDAKDGGSDIGDEPLVACIVSGFTKLSFTPPENGGVITVVYPLVLTPKAEGDTDPQEPTPQRIPLLDTVMRRSSNNPFTQPQPSSSPPAPPLSPWSNDYATVMNLIPNARAAVSAAIDLRARDAANPIALVALGQAYEAAGDPDRAARAYGSLADLYPERAEMLRAAAVRIERLYPNDPTALSLLRRAVLDRPDQPSGHHLLGLALLRAGDYEAAFDAIAVGIARRYELRYSGMGDLFATDLRLVTAAWSKAEPQRASAIEARASSLGVHNLLGVGTLARPSLHAIASWETDTSDVDILIRDEKNERVGASVVSAASDGFGPEALNLPMDDEASSSSPNKTPHLRTFAASLRLRNRGSGGDVLGVVDIIKHNGRGDVTVEPRPFAIMNQSAILELGPIQ